MEILPIRTGHKHPYTVSIPDTLGLDVTKYDQIRFGVKGAACRVVQSNSKEVSISSDLCRDLLVPKNGQGTIIAHEGTLHLGPVIGLFTDACRDYSPLPFGGRTSDFQKWLTFAQKNGGFIYVFDAASIEWETGSVRAFFYEKGKWQRRSMPLPHVIYDRVPNRRLERRKENQDVKTRLIDTYNIPWFNSGFFNKWRIYEQLKHNAVAGQYLPDTNDRIDVRTIRKKLQQYGTLYLKPKNLSHGRGIIRIRTTEDGFQCTEQGSHDLQQRSYQDIGELLKTHLPLKKRDHYCWQQGIQLIKSENRPIDFRVHVNKDQDGRWQIGAIAAKVARDDSATSHVRFGGEIKPLNALFSPEQVQYFRRILKDAAFTVSEVVDQEIDGLIAELGLDIGIDQDERIWLFEANAKPGHTCFYHPSFHNQAQKVRKLWLDYCYHLFKQNTVKPGVFLKRYN